MKVKDTIIYLIDKIKDNYTQGETRSIAFLVLEYLGIYKTDIVLKAENEVDSSICAQLEYIVSELHKNRPVQYVLGIADFYGLKFVVNENVLIPRSETEELVGLAIKENSLKNPDIIDIGTGSGCIAISLAKFIPGSNVTATDISEKCLKIAGENAKRFAVTVKFFLHDILNSKSDKLEKFDIIISNPPYVTESEKQWMHQNVLNYEPGLALFVPDEDPLRFYNKIAQTGVEILNPGGKIYVEINEKFGQVIVGLFRSFGYNEVMIIRDIHNKDRIVRAAKV